MLFWFNNRGFYLNFIQFYFDSWIAEIISTAFQCCPLLTFCLTHMSSGGHPPHGLLWSCVCLHGVSASWCCFVSHWLSFVCRLLLSREFLMCYNHSYSPLPPVWACAQFGFRYFPCFCFFRKHQRALGVCWWMKNRCTFQNRLFSFPTCELSPQSFPPSLTQRKCLRFMELNPTWPNCMYSTIYVLKKE